MKESIKASKIRGSIILITGGSGFIGSHLVEELLLYDPAEIRIIDNLSRGSHANMSTFINHPAIHFIEGDIRDMVLMDTLVKGCDFVFHMAALRINACAADPREGFEVMIESTFRLAMLCVKYNVQKVVYSSSASVYGLAQHFPTPETDHPYDNQTFYGGGKLWGEQLFRSFKFMYGLEYVALRYFNVYGPRMDTDGKYTEVMIKWLDCIRDGRSPIIYGDGSTSMDFIYVTDIARANVAALLSSESDSVFNVGNQVETSLKELLQVLIRVNGANISPQFHPENSINPVSRRLALIQSGTERLSFIPEIDLETGLCKLSDWYFTMKNRK